MSTQFNTPQAICLFPQVDTPDRNKKYSVVVAFKKGSDDLMLMKKAYDDCINAEFGEKPLPLGFKVPFHDGDKKMYQDKETGEQSVRAGYAGTVYLTMRTKDKPCVLDATGKKFAPEGSLTHGRYVVVGTNPYVWDYKDEETGMRTRGCSFGLNAVQVTNRIEALPGGGARLDPMETFSDISNEEGTSAEDDPANYSAEAKTEAPASEDEDMFG